MKKVGGVVAAIAVAVSFSGILSIESASVQTAAMAAPSRARASTRAYDGAWSVAISTVNGTCPASLRYPVIISDGRVTKADGEIGYDVTGAVYSNGGIIVIVSQNGQSATGRGRLNRVSGAGNWLAGDGQCSGTWVAQRRS